MNDRHKILFGGICGFVLVVLAQLLGAQTLTNVANGVTPLPEPPPLDPNIASAMYSVVFRNPASLLVFPFLCIVAWLIDDLPVINSRYVTHFVTIIGGCIYWLFATPSSVPRSFPYPFVVLVCNGVICGFFAGLLHRFLIARFILMMRAKFGDSPVATSLKSTNGENLLATKQSE